MGGGHGSSAKAGGGAVKIVKMRGKCKSRPDWLINKHSFESSHYGGKLVTWDVKVAIQGGGGTPASSRQGVGSSSKAVEGRRPVLR
jgi:hypothetical protein